MHNLQVVHCIKHTQSARFTSSAASTSANHSHSLSRQQRTQHQAKPQRWTTPQALRALSRCRSCRDPTPTPGSGAASSGCVSRHWRKTAAAAAAASLRCSSGSAARAARAAPPLLAAALQPLLARSANRASLTPAQQNINTSQTHTTTDLQPALGDGRRAARVWNRRHRRRRRRGRICRRPPAGQAGGRRRRRVLGERRSRQALRLVGDGSSDCDR